MSRREPFARHKQAAPLILPSLLLCNFGNLQREVERLEAAGVDALHLDVMDGQFVPNFTYGMPIVAALRQLTNLPLDVHLMIASPERYVKQFYEAGADCITFHVEATDEPAKLLTYIRQLGAAAGISLNLGTEIERLKPCVDHCDLVLVMSVETGFGAQSFNDVALAKLQAARERFGDEVILEVDGGVNRTTIRDCVAAGAEMLVVGSAIFRQPDYRAAVNELVETARTI